MQGLGFQGLGASFGVWGLRVFGFRVLNLGFGVSCLGFPGLGLAVRLGSLVS